MVYFIVNQVKKNTIEKVDGYTIRITMRGFDKPDIKIHTMFEDYMEEHYGIKLNLVDGNITDGYRIVDEKKYLIFLLKFT